MSKSHYIIPIFVPDLGCPHQCVFCNQKKITGRQDVPSGDEVLEIIKEYLATIPDGPGITREVAFYGGSFTAVAPVLQKELLAPAFHAFEQGRIDGIRVSTRPDRVTEETMVLLSAYGVNTVELGVQSMDDGVLAVAGRGHTSRDVLRAAAFIKALGINLGFQVIVGLPTDTEEKDLDTAVQLVGLRPDLVRIYPCLVLKDTPLAGLLAEGSYEPLGLFDAVQRCKKLLLMFEKEGIKVIRIGLQPSEQINLAGDVIAGPYHPAFRELVESAAARDMIEHLLKVKAGVTSAEALWFAVAGEDVSVVRGHKGSNVRYFQQKYGVKEFITETDSFLPRGTIRLTAVNGKTCSLTMKRTELQV